MSAVIPVPILPPPGVVVTETLRVSEGRYVLPFDKVRFVKDKAQKIGGNVRVTQTPMSGTPRATLCWRDFLQNQYVACGTYRKLYAFDPGYNLTDITPFSSTGTLGVNPFTTTFPPASNVVTVTHTSHGRNVGDTVIFSGATTFNNVTMNGTFIVTAVVTVNSYQVQAVTLSSAAGAGGGAAVLFSYEIGVGTELGAFGLGYGVGPYGLGPYGTPRGTSTIFTEPRVWTLDHFGVVLLATYNGGTLYAFDPTQTEPWPRAVTTFGGTPGTGGIATPMNAPLDFRAMFITPERFIVGLCDKMVLKVSSQGDPTTWTPATSNTAFQRTLQEGSKLIAGESLAPFISLVWSDSALYILQYTGSQFVYNSSLAGKDCGLISPNAQVTVDGVAYWMGADQFYQFNGSVGPITNVEDIRKYVFDSLLDQLEFQVNAIYVPKYHEIWWFYPGDPGATNPTRYVIYNIMNQTWAVGTANFYSSVGVTAARASGSHFTQGDTSPIMAGTDGFLYNHDGIGDTFNDNGNPLSWTVTLAPFAQSEGLQNMDVEGVLWDFFQQQGNISAQVNTFDRLTDPAPMDTMTAIVPPPGTSIPADTATKLLLHFDGTNGSQSIADSSFSMLPITVGGNAQVSTAASQFGGTSCLFDGINSYLSVASTPDFQPAGNFTIDFWARPLVIAPGSPLFGKTSPNGFGAFLIFLVGGQYKFFLGSTGTSWDIANGLVIGSAAINRSDHIALVRTGNSYVSLLNGVAAGTVTSAVPLFTSADPVEMGMRPRWLASTDTPYSGYLDEVRFSNGVARWNANFVPPIAPYVIDAAVPGLTDYRLGGRYLGATLSCTDLGSYMRMGKSVCFVRPSAKRR